MTTTEQTKLYEKVRHLLELAENEGATPAESANAFAMAQKMIEKYRLDTARLSSDTEEFEDIKADQNAIYVGRRRIRWMLDLTRTISRINNCYFYLSGGDFMLVGKPSDMDICRYMFGYLTREVDRLCKQALKKGEGSGKTWANSYKLGCVQVLSERLWAAQREARAEAKAAGHTTAIVKVEGSFAEVQTWVKNNMRLGKSRASHTTSLDYGGYRAGQRDGKTISLNKGLGNKTAGQLN